MLERVDVNRGTILVHGQAGISRSVAAAAILLAVALGPGQEAVALDHALRARLEGGRTRRCSNWQTWHSGTAGLSCKRRTPREKLAVEQADEADEAPVERELSLVVGRTLDGSSSRGAFACLGASQLIRGVKRRSPSHACQWER